MRVEELRPGDLEELAAPLEKYAFLPYGEYEEVTGSQGARLVLDQIAGILASGGFCFLAYRDGVPVGLASGHALAWDTEQLGVAAGRLAHLMVWDPEADVEPLLERAVNECRSRDLVHVSCRIPSGDLRAIHAAEGGGFRLMEALLTFGFRMKHDRAAARPRGFRVEACRGTDEEIRWVGRLARSAFHQDRFHMDPYLVRERADRLHQVWMENSCRGYADVVLIARDPETEAPLGFFSGKAHDQPALLPTRFGNLVLGAVSPEGRGRGVFTDLTLGGLEWARDRVDILEIGTQFTNTGACRVYLGAGFRLVRSDVTLRLWMG